MSNHTTDKPESGQPGPLDSMSKLYTPIEHEDRIRARWDAAKAFAADPSKVLSGERKAYSMLMPPPNVTGALHLGHALNNTLQDILTRSHRMMGYEALWMPGTDHAGIATQAVVERRMRQDGLLKGPLKDADRNGGWTRDKFVAKVQEWKDEYEARITGQLKSMGCSCDFDRQRFTMDPVCAAAVREAFFILFRDGLIYRGKRLVNWDPALQTAVADDECYDEEINGNFYYLRYPLVHASSMDPAMSTGGARGDVDPMPLTWGELARRGYPGADQFDADLQAWVTVATTRPETYLGDTGVAINPHDPRARALRGVFVELPLVGRIIPIVEDDYVVLPRDIAERLGRDEDAKDPKSEFASGFLKVTPAHDQNDYELGQRHGLKMTINVMAPDASISDKHGWTDIGDAHQFVGKKREEARKLVVKYFDDHFIQGSSHKLLEKVRPYRHSVKHSDRSKAIVEPYLSDQWYVKVTDERMAKAANQALMPEGSPVRKHGDAKSNSSSSHNGAARASSDSASNTTLQFHPERYAKTYQQWHDGIRDWCISRQLWWGHRIPVWSKSGLSTEELERVRLLLAVAFDPFFDDPNGLKLQVIPQVDGSHTMHFCARSTDDPSIGVLENEGFTQDPDVLDTWFSSALWPLSTLGWPDPAAAEKMIPGAQFQGLLDAYSPTSVLSTAREIITLWVSRMVMMNRYLMPEGWSSSLVAHRSSLSTLSPGQGRGPVPFHDVFIHAVLQDGEGRKMSKSLGNGVDPLDIIHSHGSDAMRFTLCQMTTQTQDVRMPVQKDPKTGKNSSPKFDLGRNFANKLWNAARFVITMIEGGGPGGAAPPPRADASVTIDPASLALIDRWMLARLRRGVLACEESLRSYEFNAYAEACYDLLWRDFCDFYLEAIKPTVATSASQRGVLRLAIETIVRLLHPMMPFVTEAVNEKLRTLALPSVKGVNLGKPPRENLLCLAEWPVFDALIADERAEETIRQVRELAGLLNQSRSEHKVSPKVKLVLHASENIEGLLASAPQVVQTLAGLSEVVRTPAAAGVRSASVRYAGHELTLSGLPAPVIAEGASEGSEKDRLRTLRAELAKKLGNIEGRLANPGYIAKAPPKLVEETKSQITQIQNEIKALDEKLAAM